MLTENLGIDIRGNNAHRRHELLEVHDVADTLGSQCLTTDITSRQPDGRFSSLRRAVTTTLDECTSAALELLPAACVGSTYRAGRRYRHAGEHRQYLSTEFTCHEIPNDVSA
jgi:hypothetical protein